MDTYNVSCPKKPYDVRRYLGTYNLGTAVSGRVGSLTGDQDSQAFPTRGTHLGSLRSLPLQMTPRPQPKQASRPTRGRAGGTRTTWARSLGQEAGPRGRKGGEHLPSATYSRL